MNGSEVKVILCEELESLKKQIIEQHFAAGQKASGRTAASLHIEAGLSLTCWRQDVRQEEHRRTFRLS